MNKRRLIDTNLIVRYLVQDHEAHARTAERLFAACDRGEMTLLVLPEVVAECVFVLESFYKHARIDIARVMADLIASPGIELDDLALHLDALRRYSETKLHFVDCTIAAAAAANGLAVATLDRDFRRFADVRVDLR